jgi:hypothetical protein
MRLLFWRQGGKNPSLRKKSLSHVTDAIDNLKQNIMIKDFITGSL